MWEELIVAVAPPPSVVALVGAWPRVVWPCGVAVVGLEEAQAIRETQRVSSCAAR